MRIFGSITAFKDMLSSYATVIGTAELASGSTTVTVSSGNSSAGNSGAVYLKSGTASGTRGTVYVDGGAVSVAGATSITLTTPSVVLSASPTITAATSMTLSSASHILTQGSYSATLVVPANATLTLPSVTSTLATLAGTETLTNKLVRGSGIAPLYNSGSIYTAGDLVTTADGLSIYSSILGGSNKALASEPTYWQPIVQTGVSSIADSVATIKTLDCQTSNCFSSAMANYYGPGVACAFKDTGDLVEITAHGLSNNTPVAFSTITTTTGIATQTTYYVVNAAANTFQVSDTVGGGAKALTTDGTGVLYGGRTCSFTDSGDLVGITKHGLSNGTAVYFSSITSTTGISINTTYYVISTSTDSFQVAATPGGSALALTTGGSGTLYAGKTFAVHNMRDGQSVVVSVANGKAATAVNFNCYSDAGTSLLSTKIPAYSPTTMGSGASLYSLIRIGSSVVVTSTHGLS